jgi:hypothetical protein
MSFLGPDQAMPRFYGAPPLNGHAQKPASPTSPDGDGHFFTIPIAFDPIYPAPEGSMVPEPSAASLISADALHHAMLEDRLSAMAFSWHH